MVTKTSPTFDIITYQFKKAYITAFDDKIIAIAKVADISSWMAIRSQLKRRGIESHLKYCRAIFATHLRKCGLEQELIDLYQRRVTTTVFRAHYLKTNVDEDRKRILAALDGLRQEIEGS